MELSTEENQTLVRSIVDHVRDLSKNCKRAEPWEQVAYDVDYLVMEVNSGASYEQYFRWASVKEISSVTSALQTAGLDDIAELTQAAIEIAFPGQLPTSDKQKSELTYWSEEQETKLDELFRTFEDSNGRIINRLADYIRTYGGYRT